MKIYKNGIWEQLPGGLYEPGTLITAEGEKILLSAMWGEGLTPEDTTGTLPEETTGGTPETEPEVTTAITPETEPDVTSEEPQQTEADVTTRGSSDPDDDTWDIDPDEQQGGSIAKSPIPWIMLGLGIFVIFGTVGSVIALIAIKKRGK